MASAEMSGRSISHYRLLEKLGEGGMGAVYRAFDTRLDRQVAIKLLLAEAISNPDSRRRFIHEAKTASALNHPNIVTIYEIDNADGVDFIAMEYIRGKTLASKIHNRGMRPGDALRYAIQIADALAVAHVAGIVHRDIKPANIMIADANDSVKVLDFGLAKLGDTSESSDSTVTLDGIGETKTAEGKVFGTAAYMSPEQAQGLKVDTRSDIFSFGSVLYEMLTGRRAFLGDNKMSIIAAVLTRDPTPMKELGRDIPPELVEVIELCLRKDLGRRLQTMTDLKLLLENLKEKSDAGSLARTEEAGHTGSRWWMAAAGALILAALAGGWWIGRSGATAPALRLTRLTWDSGLTVDPVLSPNGELLAYASDRSGEGNLDIWVQPVSGGEPKRLTQDPADEESPSFAPEGSPGRPQRPAARKGHGHQGAHAVAAGVTGSIAIRQPH